MEQDRTTGALGPTGGDPRPEQQIQSDLDDIKLRQELESYRQELYC